VLSIQRAESDADLRCVEELFWEYLQWGHAKLVEEYGIDLDIELLHQECMQNLDKFSPPHGSLLLARDGARATGVACMRRLGEGIGEIKRMYVREAYRGQGIGRALLRQLLEDARTSGYRAVRLDSARFMKEAHALYHSEGFSDIKPYPGSEVPEEFQKHWFFMEKGLE